MELKKNIRVGRTYEDIINATDSIWIDGKKVEEAEIVKQMPKDEMQRRKNEDHKTNRF